MKFGSWTLHCLFVFIALGVLSAGACHSPGSPSGEVITIESTVLGHPRTVRIDLPDGYAREPKRRYPLVVLMVSRADMDDVPAVVAAVGSRVEGGKMSPVILATVELDAAASLLAKPPVVDSDGLPAKADVPAFHHFLTDELLPGLEERYRTDGTRELMGTRDAGLLVVDVLFSSPWWLDRWIAIDPTFGLPDAWHADGAALWLHRHPNARGQLLVVWSDDQALSPQALNFRSALSTYAGSGLGWDVLRRPDEIGADFPSLAAESLLRQNPLQRAGAPAPSRAAGGDCAWKRFADPDLGVRLWVTDCPGPLRYKFSVVENHIEQHRPDDDRIFGSHVALEMLRKPARQSIEDALRDQFIAKLPAEARDGCKVERIRRRGLAGDKFVFTLAPTGKYRERIEAELRQYPRDFGCGPYGKGQDETYFEYHPDESRTRFAFVVYGMEEPLFDERTLVFEGP